MSLAVRSPRPWLLALALMALAAPAHAFGGYSGDDAGWLVFSVAACKGPPPVNLNLTFREAGRTGGDSLTISPNGGFTRRDFEEPAAAFGVASDPNAKPPCAGAPLTGVVQVYRLRPGDYRMTWKVATVGSEIGAFHDAGADITVRPRHTLYIGEFVAIETRRASYMTSQLTFSDVDRHDRDLGIAHLKTPDLGPADTWRDPTAVITGPQPIYVH